MKKYILSKGFLAGLLTLALCLTCFGYVKASAAAGDSHTITFQAKVGSENKGTYEVTYKEGTAKEVTLADVLDKLGKADECLYVQDGDPSIPADKGVSFADAKFSIADTAKEDVTVTVGVKSPVVTFNVTVKDMLGDEAGAYTFTAGTSFQKKNASIQASDFLGEMKNGDNTLADASAWVVAEVTANNEKFTYSNGKFTLAADLADNLTIVLTVTNSKAPVKFTYDGFTATFQVENKKGDSKILFTDIVDGLKKKVDEEDKTYAEVKEIPENIILSDGFAENATVTGKYATWFYTVKLADVVSTAPDAIAITAGKIEPAFIANDYDPATDSIKFVSKVDLDVHWIDCKKAAGVQAKGEKLSTLSLKQNKVTGDANFGKYEGYISLSSKDDGVKVAESKTAYIYASIAAPAADKTKYTANYVVDATPYKKIAVTFGYTLAQKDKLEPAIASITTIDNKKKTVVYSGLYDADTNPDNYLVRTAATQQAAAVYSDIFNALQYSTDGTTWYKIVGNDLVNGKQVNDLNLDKLYSLVNGGSKTTLYFRIKGAAATAEEGTEGQDDYKAAANAYRATKPVKAAVDAAKAGKAVKVDVSKGTLALKNGYDFTMTAGEKDVPAFQNAQGEAIAWTILPFNKGGKAKATDAEGNEVDTAIIETVNYVPAAKVTENDEMFTNIKVKAYSVDDIALKCGQSSVGSGKMYIWVRKSATTKKPAEQWTLITLDRITAAPAIANAKGAQYYIAQAADDTKGVIGTPEIKNGSGDKNSGAYEYLIVDAADIKTNNSGTFYADIDYTSAKWTTLNDKGLTVGKSKSKYSNEEGKKASDHVLKDGSVILVRRAGDKSSNILASQYIVTMVVKQDVEVEVEKDGKKEKETKSLLVWKAYSAQ
ncbi:MAG: hypothetical protein K6E62_06225 [Lachnospiraceae bacterium]|nr:hypothetical protein [Lachnospiraceae bacterium]